MRGDSLIEQGVSLHTEFGDEDFWHDWYVADCFSLLERLYLLYPKSGLGKGEYETLLHYVGKMVLDNDSEAQSRWDIHFKDVVRDEAKGVQHLTILKSDADQSP